MQSMELKKLLSYTRQAVDDYKLIEEGDHIAVGISGGKDSLTLLYALAGLETLLSEEIHTHGNHRRSGI